MAESLIQNRIIFSKKGEQKKFLLDISKSLNLSWKQLSSIADVHDRTVRDWVNEKTKMPYTIAKMLSKKARTPLPKNIQIIKGPRPEGTRYLLARGIRFAHTYRPEGRSIEPLIASSAR